MAIPTYEQIRALDGRLFARLGAAELRTFRFCLDRGRRYGVTVAVDADGLDSAMLSAASPRDAESRLRRGNGRIQITISPNATTERTTCP